MARKLSYTPTRFGNIAYEERGQGPAAVFVHGVLLNGYFWRNLTERLSDLRRCLALDLLAHGGSVASPLLDLSFTAQADMLLAFCDSQKLDQIDLVANDSGAGIAQIFAAKNPARIRSLVLTNSDTHDNWPPPAVQPFFNLASKGGLFEVGQKMLADPNFARTMLARGYERPDLVSDETLHTYLQPIFGREEAGRNVERFVAAWDCKHTVAIEPLLQQLRAPTLVVWGTDDVFFELKWAYWLQKTIPGCKRVVEFEGARLFFPEERADALAKEIRTHWQEHSSVSKTMQTAAAD